MSKLEIGRDYPEIDPKNNWWKDVKDTISENKISICICSVSIGAAMYFYYKYQITSCNFAETLKRTIEAQEEVKRFILIDSELKNLKVKHEHLQNLFKQEKELFNLKLQNVHYQNFYSIENIIVNGCYALENQTQKGYNLN